MSRGCPAKPHGHVSCPRLCFVAAHAANNSLEHDATFLLLFGSVLTSTVASDCIVFIGLSMACD